MLSKKIKVIIEKTENELWGRIEANENFLPVTCGDSTKEILDNLVMLIQDYQQHEKKSGDKFWLDIDLNNIKWELLYDLQAFFSEYNFINISAIARRTNMNESLLRQYATGKKFPSLEQAKKIEHTIKQISKELSHVSLYAEA